MPIRVTINGVTYRSTIADMGTGPVIPVRREIRNAAGVERNDRLTVTIEEDRAKRTVTVPAYLKKAMNARERAIFDALAYSHRKEYVEWVADAKKPETRARRIAKVLDVLRRRPTT